MLFGFSFDPNFFFFFFFSFSIDSYPKSQYIKALFELVERKDPNVFRLSSSKFISVHIYISFDLSAYSQSFLRQIKYTPLHITISFNRYIYIYSLLIQYTYDSTLFRLLKTTTSDKLYSLLEWVNLFNSQINLWCRIYIYIKCCVCVQLSRVNLKFNLSSDCFSLGTILRFFITKFPGHFRNLFFFIFYF